MMPTIKSEMVKNIKKIGMRLKYMLQNSAFYATLGDNIFCWMLVICQRLLFLFRSIYALSAYTIFQMCQSFSDKGNDMKSLRTYMNWNLTGIAFIWVLSVIFHPKTFCDSVGLATCYKHGLSQDLETGCPKLAIVQL